MNDDLHPAALTPPLLLRIGDETAAIATLDEALLFAERHPLEEGDYPGLIRRLQGAERHEDVEEAANAFRWWAQVNGLIAGTE